MRILHVITALGRGGCENMLARLLTAEALAEHEQRVVSLLPRGELAQHFRSLGTQVDELDLLGPVALPLGVHALRGLARRYEPDVVQGWMYHGNLGALLAASSAPSRPALAWGIRQSLPSLQGENVFARVGIALNRRYSQVPQAIVANSQTSISQHAQLGFDMSRAVYIPNGFDTTKFTPDALVRASMRRAWSVTDADVVFGLIARYHPAKGHASFLEAAAALRQRSHAVHFVMAGTGVHAGNRPLSALIQELGLSDCVTLLGPRTDVEQVMAGLDVCVSASSRLEAFSNSVGEAMSCGVPCIVTAVGDSPMVVGTCGMVVPPTDRTSMEEAMVAMIEMGVQGRRQLGDMARQRITKTFEIEAVAAQFAALYVRLRETVSGSVGQTAAVRI